MKTYSKLPTINGIELAGRIASDPQINGKRARFTVIRNMGGDKDETQNYVDVTVNYFSEDGTFPAFLKKAAPVIISGYFVPENFELDGKKFHNVGIILKKNGLKEATIEVIEKDGKTIKKLPSLNNVEFSGRLAEDPDIKGKRARFTLLRNFGGDKGYADLTFDLFSDNSQFPEYLKQGSAVTVKAYCEPDNWLNKDGEKRHRVNFVVKKNGISLAELTQVSLDSKEANDAPNEEPIELGVELS